MTSPAPDVGATVDALQKRMAQAMTPFLGQPVGASREALVREIERFFSFDENLAISARVEPDRHSVTFEMIPKTALGALMIQYMREQEH